jgi:hypothetical protein
LETAADFSGVSLLDRDEIVGSLGYQLIPPSLIGQKWFGSEDKDAGKLDSPIRGFPRGGHNFLC